MRGSPQSAFQDERTPAQCRTGPVEERRCTDPLCWILYLLLVAAVIFFGIISSSKVKMSQEEIEEQLVATAFGQPLLAISRSMLQIILAVACAFALCLILTITTFLVPSLVTFVYIPLMLLLMLLLGVAFLYRFFGQSFPFINRQAQDRYVQRNSILSLGVGILFLLAVIITIITICCKKERFRNILPVLQMAKVCFWDNCYLFFVAFFLSAISVFVLYINLLLLEISQNKKNQQKYVDHLILAALIIVEVLFTHGFMQSLSDFIFQSVAIHWYFNGKKHPDGYSKCSNNCSTTLGLTIKHIGTILYGSIYAYLPEVCNFWVNSIERMSPAFYDTACCIHKCACRRLSRYSHCETILQGLHFCAANKEMLSLRRRTKAILPEIYLMGNFFMTIAKILVTMIAVVICYILLLESDPSLFGKVTNLIPPLIVTFLASLEIATHFFNCTGLLGDTIAFMYAVDLEIEKSFFGELEPYSCPVEIRKVIQNVKIGEGVYDS